MSEERDIRLQQLAGEILRVYWAARVDASDPLSVRLPVLDGDVLISVAVQGGVFTVRSAIALEGELDDRLVHQLNGQMPGASYCYVPDGDKVWIQSKFLVPDLDLDRVRPHLLSMAFSAGWQAAGGQGENRYSGPSGYEHFVYLADFLAGAIHEHWTAQQGNAALSLEER